MNNDLISREALKEAINTYDKFVCLLDGKLYPTRELKHPEMFVSYMHVDDVIKAIDNAPTVEQNWRFYYDHGYKQAERDLKRPQGKWIYPEKTDKEKGYGGYCSNCKCDMPIFVEDWKQKYCETKFCPNCGADMRGGAE